GHHTRQRRDLRKARRKKTRSKACTQRNIWHRRIAQANQKISRRNLVAEVTGQREWSVTCIRGESITCACTLVLITAKGSLHLQRVYRGSLHPGRDQRNIGF